MNLLFDQLKADLAYAWRGLGRNPGFTIAALLTLVVTIGASTTMFSLAEAVLLRPLPYAEPERLVAIWSEVRRQGVSQARSAYANIEAWRGRSQSFSALAAYDGWSAILTSPRGESRKVSALMASPELWDTLRVQPMLGRTFTTTEAERRDAVAVLSHGAWQGWFNADPGAIGAHVVLDDRLVEIIGVAPPAFAFPDGGVELWVPHTFRSDWQTVRVNRGTDSWHVVARLADGVLLEAAQTELAGIAQTLEVDHPEANRNLGVRVVSFAAQAVGQSVRQAFLVLIGAVVVVQLIACSNLASLLLARASARHREFAIREALGASRARLVRQMLVETLLLTFLAALGGTLLASLALKAVLAWPMIGIPRLAEARLDGVVLLFTILLAFVSALLAGLLPALTRARNNLVETLRGAGRGLSEVRVAGRLRGSLVVLEFGLAIMLVMTTGLLLRSFARLTAVDTGFRSTNVLVVGLTLPPDRSEPERIAFGERLLEQVRALPGVRSAGTTEDVLLGLANERTITVTGPSAAEPAVHRLRVNFDGVSPDYFRTVGVALRRGRFFSAQDGPQAPPVVIVNETLARRLWPNWDPLGQLIRVGGEGPEGPWMEVVGVVADLRRQDRDEPPAAQAFRPFAQQPSRGMNLAVDTELDAPALAHAVRTTVAAIDPTIPVSGVATLRQILDQRLAPREFNLRLAATFAAIALLLAGVGVFGLMNYTVVQRTQEIGVRMALGARPGQVMRMVMGQGIRLAVTGIIVGTGATLALTPAVRSLLYEVSPFDPATAIVTILLLSVVAAVACYVPARRVTLIDPVIALRAER